MPEIDIAALGARGDGIGDLDGRPVYVPYTLPGDRARVRIDGGREGVVHAHLEALLHAGPARVDPVCGHFGACGGCLLQHVDAATYRRWKTGLIGAALARRGLADVAVGALIMTPPASRRRAQFAARRRRNGVVLGFNERRGRRIVDLAGCHVLRPAIVGLLPSLRRLLTDLLSTGDAIDVQVTETDTGLDLWLRGERPLGLAEHEAIGGFAEAQDVARLCWGDPSPAPVVVRRTPTVALAGVEVAIPPGAFLQASRDGEAALRGVVGAALAESRHVLDLFSGCGTFALAAPTAARVTAVDADAGMVDALAAAARGRPVSVERRDLQRRPFSAAELNGFDAIVFDPPRAGAREQADAIASSTAPTVVAISCNPATFARDARILIDGGYRLNGVTPIDQFLWSHHLELVAVFAR